MTVDDGLLEAALAYAARAWCVLPVRAGTKAPRLEKWQDRATTDSSVIEEWFGGGSEDSIGILTGSASGLVVLDVDPRNGGEVSLLELVREYGPLPPTYTVRSGGGGWHYYFKRPGGEIPTKHEFRPGLDLQAEGTHVVAPPSLHATGVRYVVENDCELAPLPAFLLEPRPAAANSRSTNRPPASDADQQEFAGLLNALGVQIEPGDHKYRCCFHPDDDPSLSVDAGRCVFNCFGCDAQGGLAALRRLVPSELGDRSPSSLTSRPRTICAADIVPESITWLWEGRIPFGTLTVVSGPPGQGKSTILCDRAADASQQGLSTLVATAEDHLAKVARPRLEAAGADLNLVHFYIGELGLPGQPDSPGGYSDLAEEVRRLEARLVVLDPLVAFIGEGVNTHRDHDVRRVLARLSTLAEETGAAVLVVVHTNKSVGADPLMRVSGSIGIVGAARCVLLAAQDPQDEGKHVLAVVKSNLAIMAEPLGYEIVGAVVGDDIPTSRISWLGEVDVDVSALLASPNPEERGALPSARAFLSASGVAETAQLASTLYAEAKRQGFSERTLGRARKDMGIDSWKTAMGGGWMW